ncbi:hypothetical protein [Pedobacter panaciterrae]
MCEQTNPDLIEQQNFETLQEGLLDVKKQSIALRANLDKIIIACDHMLYGEEPFNEDGS